MNATDLLKELEKITLNNITEVEAFQKLPLTKLNWKSDPKSWSILECIEHLNLYGDFYLPEIEKQLSSSESIFENNFRSGLIGNYFAKLMLPRQPLNKMKTLKDKNPLGSALEHNCLEKFLIQQQELLKILDLVKHKSLNKIKTSISISKWLKLKLGDTLRVVIYHNFRHVLQANNALKASI
ncbi:DinB family protein [Urechidicola vernalis]|uniref:DinB family protein n=1 Tax=Urechidicola vernalis TaxID=3075600 RepID=A0ABU2Y2D7_9FLAO|nr:DinB family protein [Urechidicola sp. P050]MDT0552331.1 DinB family protein [Urechidicola sp. P050]